ncbi:MAG TPA: sialidase family protein [Blastocatellia bacterium]|nr:sialidase family protein [Blastocatellia bacterium]
MKSIMVLIVFLLCYASASAQTHDHGAMQSGDGNFNPFVVSDSRGGFYFTYVQRTNGASNVMVRHSADGRSFDPPVRVNDRDGDSTVRNENPPKIAVSRKGDVYVCWANETARWKGNIRFARSTVGGKAFLPAITINSDAMSDPAGHAFQSVATDRSGRVYVVWIDERDKKPADRGAEIWMSTSDDGGKTFSRDRKILSQVCECCRSNIQIDASGRLFLAYRTVPNQGPMFRDIVLAVSADRGGSFSTRVVSHDGWEINACPVAGPSLCVDASNRITVIWFTGGGDRAGLYYASSSDLGVSFSKRRLLDSDQKLGKHAQAVAHADGQIIVAWDDSGDKPLTQWGTLNEESGLLRKRGVRSEAIYPVVAASKDVMVVVGLQTNKDVFVQTESLKNP